MDFIKTEMFFFRKQNSKKTTCMLCYARSLQLCLTLCDPIDGSPPGPAIPGILQARTLEWVAMSSSTAWKWKVKGKSLSRVRLLATSWTAAHQAPLSMGLSRQEYWSGVPVPSWYINATLPICLTLLSLPMSTRLFSTSASLFLLCKRVHRYHFSRFHLHVSVYNTSSA